MSILDDLGCPSCYSRNDIKTPVKTFISLLHTAYFEKFEAQTFVLIST